MKKLLLTLMLGSMMAGPALAEDVQLLDVPHVQVVGQCFARISPDRGHVTVTSEFRHASDAKIASSEATQAYERALQAIKKLGLKDAEYQTTGYNLNEVREWVNNQNVFRGYVASVGVTVTTSETSRLGDVIAAATSAGLKSVSGLYTDVSQTKLNEAYAACYEQAVVDARKKAERMLAPVKSQVGRVLQLSTSDGYMAPPPVYSPRPEAMMMKAADAMPAPTIETKDRDLRLNVNAIFEIR